MSQSWSKAVPEGNDPISPQEELAPDQPTLADVYRLFEKSFDRHLKIMKNRFDQQENKLNECMEMRATEQRSASREQDARQPSLAMEADVPADTKTRWRTESAATAVQAMHGDSFSSKGSKPTRPARPVSANLPLSLAGMTSWSRTALRCQSRVSQPWECAHQQPPGAYFPPTKPLQRRGLLFTSYLFGSA